MWFAYPQNSNWIALDLKEVKKIQEQNKKGIKPERLAQGSEIEESVTSGIEIGKDDLIADKDINWLDKKSKEKKQKSTSKKRGNFKNRTPKNKRQDGGRSKNKFQ
ncbi:MAG: Uncharacterised protein [Bacteroidetes bacterium MED-G17]|nr:MAG: Uncharacterised protein [Bacteroidetes bacterium MED-G17]